MNVKLSIRRAGLGGAAACLAFACRISTAADSPHIIESVRPSPSATSFSTTVAIPEGSPAAEAARIVPGETTVEAAAEVPILGGCRLFPPDNPWNRDISAAPVHPRSAAYIESIGADAHLHADFGSNPEYGIPINVAPDEQTRVPVEFVEYGDESDPGPYPIPSDARVESGSDRHLLVLASGECRLYELYHARRAGSGWQAGSGAIFDLSSNALRPDGWTSADAAGLPILPGLARYDEVQTGAIRHALRVTVKETYRGYIRPATHFASRAMNPDLPPMGLRLRLRADYDVSRFTGDARVILEALKRYGLIVADNGSSWFITGETDSRWNDEDLNQLKTVPGSAFEAVYTGEILP
ncbi:MAG: hypothetical protein JW929_02350 [Anaerolineales bacterium]|nr:hypothetical protein [Anaerolineales bacterium]